MAKQHLIEYIQKNYTYGQDIAISLREMRMINMDSKKPNMLIAQAEDPVERRVEQRRLDISYQAEVTRWMERRNMLENNMIKAYSLIISNYCTSQMRSRVETHADYHTEILDNPICLLEVIQVLMHDTV